jgi:hypothetical protein
MTSVTSFSLESMTTVTIFAGINDKSDQFFAGVMAMVNFFAVVNENRGQSLVSLTPARNQSSAISLGIF